ncbi:hypothetical protein RRG08_035172 [Elysia crispata]|uniref:DDE Tnp4 domain-containing protein n=1 Tax=Elysia crispata TaxID=231223 RepID=A0AAE1AXT6_9GAST|nr:hypothetical protein RRG08_035172 [Elysia crispata]
MIESRIDKIVRELNLSKGTPFGQQSHPYQTVQQAFKRATTMAFTCSISTSLVLVIIWPKRAWLLSASCESRPVCGMEERLVITLRYLGNGTSFRSLAFSFRMGKTTVAEIVYETVVAIWEELQPIHMPVPSEENLRSVAAGFLSNWNFPNCVGAIDGKHVPIRCPSNSGSMFFNYKKFFSVTLQGVSDANYRFINIDVGGYGKQSDGGTFQASEFYRALTDGKINLPKHSFLPQTNVVAPYVLIGDEAYPLLPFVLKPSVARICLWIKSASTRDCREQEKQLNVPLDC